MSVLFDPTFSLVMIVLSVLLGAILMLGFGIWKIDVPRSSRRKRK